MSPIFWSAAKTWSFVVVSQNGNKLMFSSSAMIMLVYLCQQDSQYSLALWFRLANSFLWWHSLSTVFHLGEFGRNPYILVVVGYISQWIDAKASKTKNMKVEKTTMQGYLEPYFGIPKAITSDQGTHFCNGSLQALRDKYKDWLIVKVLISTPV